MAAASIDVDQPAKYPIVLSDALLGKASKDLYTSIRYNHKPRASSSTPDTAHLQPSDSDPTSYDLSLSNDSDQYLYNGVRTSGDGKYVLIFDPAKKHFVLHRLDSTFDMNLVKAPWDDDESSLRSSYPQLETASSTQRPRKQSKSVKSQEATSTGDAKRRKAEKPPKKGKPKARSPTPESEADDSDDGLTIEYPDGSAPAQYRYQSTPVFRHDPSEEEVSEEDGDDEQDYQNQQNRDVEALELPSPVNNDVGGITEEDMELDLEAELEQALQETTVEMTHSANENQSDESEEE